MRQAKVDVTDIRRYARGMSTPAYVAHEPDRAAITQRLRSYMGDKKISRSKLALASGIHRTTLGGKLDGQTDFTLDELLAIAHALGKHWLWVMSGDEPPHPHIAAPDDVSGAARSDVLPRVDSNHQPSGLRLRAA